MIRSLYARLLKSQLTGRNLPRHVAVVMDGNRRWAREAGYDDPRIGHQYGAAHVDDLLAWCAELGVRHVTVYVCSIDNLRKRDSAEVANLMEMMRRSSRGGSRNRADRGGCTSRAISTRCRIRRGWH